MTAEKEPPLHICECEICRIGTDAETVRNHHRINLFLSRLTEPQRRWYVAMLSDEPDSPSERQLALLTGLDEKTIRRGRDELEADLSTVPPNRQRRAGGGRLRAEKKTRR